MDTHQNNRISAVILLFLLLLLSTMALSAQGLSPSTSRSSISNNPTLVVTPRMVPRGATTTVAYTLLPGYGNKVDIEVMDDAGTIRFSQSLAFPTGRFSYPLATASLNQGQYTVKVKNGNLIHSRGLRVTR